MKVPKIFLIIAASVPYGAKEISCADVQRAKFTSDLLGAIPPIPAEANIPSVVYQIYGENPPVKAHTKWAALLADPQVGLIVMYPTPGRTFKQIERAITLRFPDQFFVGTTVKKGFGSDDSFMVIAKKTEIKEKDLEFLRSNFKLLDEKKFTNHVAKVQKEEEITDAFEKMMKLIYLLGVYSGIPKTDCLVFAIQNGLIAKNLINSDSYARSELVKEPFLAADRSFTDIVSRHKDKLCKYLKLPVDSTIYEIMIRITKLTESEKEIHERPVCKDKDGMGAIEWVRSVSQERIPAQEERNEL